MNKIIKWKKKKKKKNKKRKKYKIVNKFISFSIQYFYIIIKDGNGRDDEYELKREESFEKALKLI